MGRQAAERVANPRDAEAALAWQLERVGSSAWQEWTLKFQRLAFGYAHDSGWHDGADALRWLDQHTLLQEGTPPRGTLVWYQVGERVWVACSLGAGRIVGPLPSGQVGVEVLTDLSTDYVWSHPHFPFAQ